MSAPPSLKESDLRQLVEVARYLGEQSELDALLSRIIDCARQLLDAERATVFLYDQARHELYSRLGTDIADIRISADQGIAGRCARSRQLVHVPDCDEDPDFNRAVDHQTGYRTRNLLAVPLVGMQQELVGVLEILNKRDAGFTPRDEAIATALASQCAVALQRAHFFEDRLTKEKLERDLALARQIQQDLLPATMPQLVGYEVVGWTRPADQTGGDLYDAGSIDDQQAWLLLCDATGHGIGPALSVSQVRTMFRLAARLGLDLGPSVAMINEQLMADLPAGRFVTAFVGRLDARNHQIHYRSAGQAPLLHVRDATGDCDRLDASAPPMGITPGVETPLPEPIKLAPGDVLAIPSDGLFEQHDADGHAFGIDRLVQTVIAHRHHPMTDLATCLRDTLDRFAGETTQGDDMSVLLVRRRPESGTTESPPRRAARV
jgi:phosphoserine phosphatase